MWTRLHEKMNENKKLVAPLKRMQEDVLRLRSNWKIIERKKRRCDALRPRWWLLKAVNLQYRGSMNLLQRFADLKKSEMSSARTCDPPYDVQKSAFRNLLLEKKLAAMHRVQEEREAQLNEVLTRANLEPTVLGQVKGHVEDVLQKKNAEARKLQSEVARLQAKQEHLQKSIVEKMEEYGLGVSELGFTPVSAEETIRLHKTVSLK